MLLPVAAWLRIAVTSALLVGGNVLTAVGVIPKSWNLPWLPFGVASVFVLGFYVTSEWRREHDRALVTDIHRSNLHDAAASLQNSLDHNWDCGGDNTLIRQSFSVHFRRTADAITEWNKIVQEALLAEDGVGKQITADAPGVAVIVREVAQGGSDPSKYEWSIESNPQGAQFVKMNRGQDFVTFYPKEGEDAAAVQAKWSTLFESVPSWPSVLRRAAALQRQRELWQTLSQRLAGIRLQDQIRRNRACDFCFPKKD